MKFPGSCAALNHASKRELERETMVYSSYTKQRIAFYHEKQFKPPTIQKFLLEEGLCTTRQGIARFLKVYQRTGTVDRCRGSGRPSKASTAVREIVDQEMRRDDETTAVQLKNLLATKGHKLGLNTVRRCRRALGWTHRGSAYCQLIREANKEKRVVWAGLLLSRSCKPSI